MNKTRILWRYKTWKRTCYHEWTSDKSWNLRCKMIGVAEINEIPYQLAASYAGGTNTSAIQEGAFDCETMLVSIPQRNMHTQVEVCDYRDVEGAIDLISKTLLEITK